MSELQDRSANVCLPPVMDRRIETLILGSFPGQASLNAAQYYAHKHNQFWRLMSAVLDCDLAALPYRARLGALLAHRIGLWDIIAHCERNGSLDSAIRNARHNDFALLKRRAPPLNKVCFNGKTAARCAPQFAGQGYAILLLPSSSPAFTVPFETKLASWRRIVAD
ncbi:MAG: DNA-deoxyinosine glycosylase [Burkholderiales bacterium]